MAVVALVAGIAAARVVVDAVDALAELARARAAQGALVDVHLKQNPKCKKKIFGINEIQIKENGAVVCGPGSHRLRIRAGSGRRIRRKCCTKSRRRQTGRTGSGWNVPGTWLRSGTGSPTSQKSH